MIEIDLTAAVEHLYRWCRLLLWLGCGGIRCRGRSGHGLQSVEIEISFDQLLSTPAHAARSTACLLYAPIPLEGKLALITGAT